MIDKHIDNPKSAKYYVKRYLDSIRDELKNKIVLDVPAGNGIVTQTLLSHGAKAEPYDLFPEYFMLEGIECRRADITDKLPVENNYADMLICQEGIEHFSDQVETFREFARVLKVGGQLIVTTPSYSNLSAKWNYLIFEAENSKEMPPNEINDIWMSDKSVTNEIYHGHIFLVGLQKLRTLAKLAGFKIKEIRYVRLSKGSLFLFPFLYPFILVQSYFRFLRGMKKNENIPYESKKAVYGEQLRININPKNLLNHHTFVVYEKEKNLQDVTVGMKSLMKSFDAIM